MEIAYEYVYSFGLINAKIPHNFYLQGVDVDNKFISIGSYTSNSTITLSSFNDRVGIQNDPQIVATIIKDKNA